MTAVWTHGRWTVAPGREAEFIEAWSTLARASIGRFGSEPPTLLRDREQPNEFLSRITGSPDYGDLFHIQTERALLSKP